MTDEQVDRIVSVLDQILSELKEANSKLKDIERSNDKIVDYQHSIYMAMPDS